MPQILIPIGAAIAALTVVEIIVIAAVIAVGLSVVTSRNMSGIIAAPPTPGAFQTNPLQLTLSNDAPRRMVYGKARVSGVILYWNVSGDGFEYLSIVVAVACHRIQEITGVYFDGKEADVVAGGYYDFNYYQGDQLAADPTLMATFPEWNANCILRDTAYAIVRLKYDRTIWQNGRPNIQFDVLGKNDIYDPRTGLRGWSNNMALCTADYMTYVDGLGATEDEMDWDTVAAAADVSDQLPEGLAASMCDGRYTTDGVVELTSRNGDVVTQMLAAGAGTVIWSEGKFRLFVGAARTPVDRAITDEDLAEDFSLQPFMSADQTFNGVKGVYLSATENWIYTDFPPVLSQGYVDIDGGLPVYKDINLQFTTSPLTAQRLANIFLRRARLEIGVMLKCKWTCFNYEVWDVVPLSIPQLGWDGKLFQITDWRMSPPSTSGTGGIELSLVEYSDEIYSDTMDLKPITPPGVIQVPDVTTPAALAVLFATSDITTTGPDGQPFIRFDWAASTDIYAVGYEIALGKFPFVPGEGDYRLLPGKNTFTYTAGPFLAGDSYQGFIRVVNSFDRRSAVTASGVVVATSPEASFPEAPEGLTATLPSDTAVDLSWVAPATTPAQVEVRWGPTNEISSAAVVSRFAGGPTSVRLNREALDGFYFVGFVSGGGLYGPFNSVFVVARAVAATTLQTLRLDRNEGDLFQGVWHGESTAVPKSQNIANELGWEVFDVLVPNPFTEVRYFAKNARYVVGGELRVSGNVGTRRAPGLPGTLPVVPATAEVAYFGLTEFKLGQFALSADANVKTGFILNHSEAQGLVMNSFGGVLQQIGA